MALFVVVAATLTAGIGLPSPPQVAAPAHASTTHIYDGRALLEGTFFGWGPFAQEYPQLILPERPVVETPHYRAYVNEVIEAMEVLAPGQLVLYKRAMYSGIRTWICDTTLDTLTRFNTAVGYLTDNTGGSADDGIYVTAGVSGKVADRLALLEWAGLVATLLGPPT